MEHGRRWSTVLAGALVLPATLFVGANVLKYGFGVDALSDVLGAFAEPVEGAVNIVVTALVLVGPLVAIAIAILPIVLGRSDGTVEATVSLRVEWARVAIVLVALAVLAVLAGHIAAENAACWLGSARAC